MILPFFFFSWYITSNSTVIIRPLSPPPQVLINGKVVTQSPWCAMDDLSMTVTLDLPVTAVVTSLPHTLTLQLLHSTATPLVATNATTMLPATSTTVAIVNLPLASTESTHIENGVQFKGEKVREFNLLKPTYILYFRRNSIV